MRTIGWMKTGAVAMSMVFCIFFGVSLATQGTERLHGPLQREASAAQPRVYVAAGAADSKSAAAAPIQAKVRTDTKAKPQPRPEPASDTGVGRIGNKAGEFLQIMAFHTIGWFVGLFEWLLR